MVDNRKKIMNCIYEDSLFEFHIRLLARMTKLHPNTVMKETDELEKEGLVVKIPNKLQNRTIIKGNTNNIFFLLSKKFHNIEKIYKSGIIEYLNTKMHYPTVVLFGSYAKAENHKESDIDLFIISEEKVPDLLRFERKLNTEIQVFVHTKKSFRKLQETSPELLNNVMDGYVLTGYVECYEFQRIHSNKKSSDRQKGRSKS
ncbi:nucleotidyltransferase domain-containing protein [Nanoarchaeota archaeon]